MAKLIKIDCYHPIAIPNRDDIEDSWADVWISFTRKPGRYKEKLFACLVGKYALVRDITFEKEFVSKYPQFEDTSKVTIQKLEAALDKLATDAVVVDEDGENAPLCLYTQNNTVTRKVAEQMISTYLHTKYGFNCKFKWKKPRFITIPV